MNKKFLALAAAGAAYYLFKTPKGNEMRENLTKQAGQLGQKLKDQYQQYRGSQQTTDQPDNSMA
jgi:hypothetical protein